MIGRKAQMAGSYEISIRTTARTFDVDRVRDPDRIRTSRRFAVQDASTVPVERGRFSGLKKTPNGPTTGEHEDHRVEPSALYLNRLAAEE